MPIKINPTYVVTLEYICDECKEGKMTPTGETLASSPPWYVHKCDSCHSSKRLRKLYPTIEYVKDGCKLDLTKMEP